MHGQTRLGCSELHAFSISKIVPGKFVFVTGCWRWEERVHAQATARQVPTGGALGSHWFMQVVRWVWRGTALALQTSALGVPAGRAREQGLWRRSIGRGPRLSPRPHAPAGRPATVRRGGRRADLWNACSRAHGRASCARSLCPGVGSAAPSLLAVRHRRACWGPKGGWRCFRRAERAGGHPLRAQGVCACACPCPRPTTPVQV